MWMCGPPKCIFCELSFVPTSTPSGRCNAETRCRRGLPLVQTYSTVRYASFMWRLWPSNMYILRVMPSTNCTPSGRLNSEMRPRSWLIRMPACFPELYAYLVDVWPGKCLSSELCSPPTGTPNGRCNTLKSPRWGLVRRSSCFPDSYHLLIGCVTLQNVYLVILPFTIRYT